MDFFPVKLFSIPTVSFVIGVVISAVVNLTIAFAFAYSITWGIESALH